MIYLDNNATTPILPEVFEAMEPYFRDQWGNPSSSYRFGSRLKKVLETAREQVADLIGAHPLEIIFTSGGTESDNTALHTILRADPAKRHIITSAVEHSAVLGFCRSLEEIGFHVTYLPVDRDGLLSIADLEGAITPETAGVSLMWANNETGVLFPVEQIATICRARGILFHCDAVQAVGKVTISVKNLPIDYLALTGHKFGAPKGIGALYVRRKAPFTPLVHGGHQEGGRRGGTENLALIAGFGVASELSKDLTPWSTIDQLRQSFEQRLLQDMSDAMINGNAAPRLPNTTNVYLPGIDSDVAVTFLDQSGICMSSGSACLESALTPSHVILAMSGSHAVANESIRLSLSKTTTEKELATALMSMRGLAALAV